MAVEAETGLRQEIAAERRELTNAVADLRVELGHTAERGKKLGARVGAVTGGVLALRTVVRLVRRRKDKKK
jgi:hypothetical protein